MNFIGRWRNEEGNELRIRRFFKDLYLIKYIRKDGKLSLSDRFQLFIYIFPFGAIGKIVDDVLEVDLYGPMGPSLSLNIDHDTMLIVAEIGPSLYDGYEHITGINCLEPLSPFRRIKK